jgi:hypothetical protein
MVCSITVFLALALFALNSCKSDTISEPSPLGPSSMAVVFDMTANPNVIVAGERQRQISGITATLTKYDGIPFSDRTVLFEVVNEAGKRVSLGYLDGELSMQAVTTDSNGTAKAYYAGPLKNEIRGNTDIYIRATVVWEGSQHFQDAVQVFIVRDSN